MELIGELERAFAAGLYPARYVIAGVVAVAAVGLVLLARRRQWFASARRHPARSMAVIAVAVAVGAPAAWYLGSPLFIRVELNEAAPVAVASTPTPAPTFDGPAANAAVPGASRAPIATLVPAVAPSPDPTPDPTPAPTATPFAARTLAVGDFKGADSFHFGRGSASLIEAEPGVVTLRFESFSVRNGPDLHVYVSPSASGYTRSAVELGRLKATDGSFNYTLPPDLDLSGARSIVIWCKQFAVLFATAPLAWS
jgi:hypothetical protein